MVEHVDPPALRTTRPLIDEYVGDLQPATPVADTLATDAAPTETVESIVEHVDELVRPSSKPLSDKSAADLQEPEPLTPSGALPLEELPLPIETVDLQVAFPETPPIIDEHVFGPAEPVAPVIDEYVEDLHRPETPPLTETFDVAGASLAGVMPTDTVAVVLPLWPSDTATVKLSLPL